MNWIDISIPIKSGMIHFPGDPDVEITKISEIDKGDICNVSHLNMTAHTGTHMDAPLHFCHDGGPMDHLPFGAVIGEVLVVDVTGHAIIDDQVLQGVPFEPHQRLLLKTNNSNSRWFEGDFDEKYVGLANSAAKLLVEHKIQTIGIDHLSIGSMQDDNTATHQTLLKGGIWIIEGLNLNGIEPGYYEMVCLPIRLAGADGSPCRVVIRPLMK